ncbi:MAG: GNAT family N-acetyltransferase [Anaerolineae bacterium]|nr:GNAT family N-acetyltransferase [Anaerolineae bacterium]
MIDLQPAYTLTIDDLATLFNRAFAGYIGGDVHFTAEALARFLSRDNVDLDLSQIVVRDGQPVGFGYVARLGWTSRLAAFGVVPEAAGAGVGKAAMRRMIEQAKARGDRFYELEVIEQNTRAVNLYEGVGFERVRRLVGCELKSPPTDARDERLAPALLSMNVYDVGKIIMQYGALDLPWQVAGATICRAAPPNVGYALDGAYAVITNPDAEVVGLRALIVPPELRRQGRATRLMRAIFARHPGRHWVLSAIMPEDIGGEWLASLGFTRTALTQWQMRLSL